MTSREHAFAIFRNLKWIIAISLSISLALYLPDQVRELYRISAADGGWTAAKQFVAIIAIAVFIWFGAFQLATETAQRLGPLNGYPHKVLRLLPIALGILPILAAMFAQIASQASNTHLTEGEKATLREVGNVFRIQENALVYDTAILWVFFFVFFAIATLFVYFAWNAGEKTRFLSVKANTKYFSPYRYIILTACLIAGFTVIFVIEPDSPAQFLETFGIVALFTLCIVSFSIHLSLLTIGNRFPYIPLIITVGALFAAIGTNDNHRIRDLPGKTNDKTLQPVRASATDAFADWLKQPDRQSEAARSGEYPVFVVTAQGGGIYAAHNAATFLARMQDLCPAFRHHLFAISSVSGGSVGAAVFAAALNSADHVLSTTPNRSRSVTQDPCPKISGFLSGARDIPGMDQAGTVERMVQAALSTDFLSPLVAASLFAEFTQAFVPFPIGIFDRARALEYTLENAADKMKLEDKNFTGTNSNLLEANYQSHWNVRNGIPALLMNSTDAGSGKRVLIAPFDIDEHHPKESDLCMLAKINREKVADGERVTSTSLSFPLSTAAFISARFPWVTPAATVQAENDCITRNTSARLVDGGYIDNSGVETALNLIEKIEALQRAGHADEGVRAVLPKVKVYLISLAGGDFPDHGAFSFNEIMEPVRALLSGRTSRAYIALNRAAQRVSIVEASKLPQPGTPQFRTFLRTDLKNHFYGLPLGWALSDKTRDIVLLNSGRFWDCEPNVNFAQSRKALSNADCAQVQVYHLLNGSRDAAIKFKKDALMVADYLREKVSTEKGADSKVNHERLLACYEQKWFSERGRSRYLEDFKKWASRIDENKPKRFRPYRERYIAYYQSEQVRALLNEWDRLKDETSHRVLAYLLGSISYDSSDFSRTTENLSFRNEEQIPMSWRNRIMEINADHKAHDEALAEIKSVLNNPEAFANLVWGWRGNTFKNTQPGDGWKYRLRGIYQIVGRGQYKNINDAISHLYPDLRLDIVEFPDAVWNRNVSAKVAVAHFLTHKYGGKTLVELLKNDFITFDAVRATQTDMEHTTSAQKSVAERSEMFLRCIKEATQPPPAWYTVEKMIRVFDVITRRISGLN